MVRNETWHFVTDAETFSEVDYAAPNAVAMMCRRMISNLAIMNGADPSKSTGPQLQFLKDNKLIEDKLYKAAKAVKAFGDSGAHPPKSVGLEDATVAFKVTEKILYYALLLDCELE